MAAAPAYSLVYCSLALVGATESRFALDLLLVSLGASSFNAAGVSVLPAVSSTGEAAFTYCGFDSFFFGGATGFGGTLTFSFDTARVVRAGGLSVLAADGLLSFLIAGTATF